MKNRSKLREIDSIDQFIEWIVFDRSSYYLNKKVMEELAFQFLPKVKFLSLIRADITYLQDEKQFYFDKVVQPFFHCFGCSEARIVLE